MTDKKKSKSRETLHLVDNVTPIDPKVRELSDQFDEVVNDAATLVIIAVRSDGKPIFLVPDEIKDLPALICAVDECLSELRCTYSMGLVDDAD